MPMYEFRCEDCNAKYDDLTQYDETNVYPDVTCPKCQSSKKTRLMSVCGPIPNTNSHDYRYWKKRESDRDLRQAAQDAQGSTPYNAIDDISSGDNFGEVK